ncbi:MAG: prolyl oligopeptidase family serine peptidase [Crocinitomicaceae bacterium]
MNKQKAIGKLSLSLTAIALTFTAKAQQMEYPQTEKRDSFSVYFGTKIEDPYRWLEDDLSEETADWVKAQNKVTFDYLSKIDSRDMIQQKLEAIWNYEKVGAPFHEGGRKYYYKNDGVQNQYVIYTEVDGREKVFLDPNTFSKDGTVSLGQVSFSKDGNTVAYSISEGGSDWRKVIIMDVKTGKQLEDTLVDIKFSGIAWKGNEGFYYSSYDKPKGSELSAKTDQHKLYYHKLGTNQSEDKILFGADAKNKRRYVGASVTEDGRYLVVSAANSTYGNELYIADLKKKNLNFKVILDDMESDAYVMDSDKDKLYIVTDRNAPNKRLVVTSFKNPIPETWEDVIPETENVLGVSTGAGYIFASYMKDALSLIKQYDYKGKLIREVSLPGIGTASGFGSKKNWKDIYYSFQNYHTPGSTYKYDAETGKSTLYWTPKIDFDKDAFESKQVFYTSKDGTKVPMIITYKKGIKLDGTNPTLLYGYGGFNVSLTPRFSITRAVWMELGGVYAVANLRGGGEYGKAWHVAGTQMNKQNVFNDFISAGEYLIENDYTSRNYLAINGGSNGGLLVGAVMTQRPDLMKVALPAVGVLDMLRYHTFTAGAGWGYDYGTADDSREMFEYLLGYSPVHNVRRNFKYPATMVTTGDHDDRVVPAHSYKFIAELQKKQMGDAPVLIRIETDAGHGAGTPVSKQIEQAVDWISFTFHNMGV